MRIEYGRHKSWREFGFRIHKNNFIDYDEVYIDFNFWKWFVTIILWEKEEE